MTSSVLSLFQPETLDIRLAPAEDEKRRQKILSSAGPSLWRTPEFYLYGVIFLICVPLMFRAVYVVSLSTNQNYQLFAPLLTPSYFGLQADTSDQQYSGFRNNFPYLLLVIGLQLALRRASSYFFPSASTRAPFDIGFGILFLIILHGTNVAKICFLFYVNFKISRIQEPKYALVGSWVFGILCLMGNELTEGYPLAFIHPVLDQYVGLMRRWDVHFNFSMLRMVSYTYDYLQSRQQAHLRANSPRSDTETLNTETLRIETPLPNHQYSITNYYAYCLYSPLYLAGPIVTFNDFTRQSQQCLSSVRDYTRTLKYAIRFLFCLVVMESLIHFTAVVAISQTRAWEGDTPFQISMIALFNLNFIWLKLLLPWRLFRLWALMDMIDAPENMIRCVDNNYSALAFWRSWHRSFNRWTVRYIYVPLGGRKRPVLHSLIVFSFVAFWHDLQLRLLLWGWLIVLFILPEVAATYFLPKANRHLCAIGGVFNIWMMMIANLVGFCVGADGVQKMLQDMLFTADGLKYVIASSMALFVGVSAMFEWRESEKRRGINLRC